MLRRIRHYVTDTLLWLVACMGLLAIILVIAAYLFNTSVILFRTGSMEPTVPTGSAALVQEIPASEVEVGDILTVERPDQLPVTHRVISVDPGDTPQERVITMQGDANASPDASPYRITEGKVVRGSVPGMAKVIHQLGNPYVLGGITIAAAILVGWAFWPRSSPISDTPDQHEQDTHTEGNRADSSKTPPYHVRAVIGFLTAATAGLMPHTPVAQASTTDLVEETLSSQYITLTSTYAPTTRDALTRGSFSPWDIGIDIDAPSEGEARAGLQAQGDFALRVSVLACSIQWADSPTAVAQGAASCDGEIRTVAENLIISPNEAPQWIDHFQASDSPWLRLLVSLPSEDAKQPEGTTGLRLDVEAAGDELSVDSDVHNDGQHSPGSSTSPAQDLARTGGPVILLLVVALASMTLGRWVQSRSAQKTGTGR
ncbi:signal peptidase I [Yaniella sp.]|uniref:signal peptidase I n=1 Tax=Yaniella sp. TaxID=2773929 RepID=UPI00264A01CD|nr:signal peptidase I [Yaniella sp.]